jgi:prophage regulatory protein
MPRPSLDAVGSTYSSTHRDQTMLNTTDDKIKTTTGTRLLSKPEVLDRTGVTYPTLWAWMRAGTFPHSRELGHKICWLENEVEAWMKALPPKRLKGDVR